MAQRGADPDFSAHLCNRCVEKYTGSAKAPPAVQVHPLHPVVLIIGVLFALRRMSVSLRAIEQHPGVEAGAFEGWKARARRAYGLGMSACFGKVLLDFALAYLFERIRPPRLATQVIGIGLELVWLALVVVSYLRVRQAHALARDIGVEAKTR